MRRILPKYTGLLLIFVLLFSACAAKPQTSQSKDFYIYYLNNEGTGFDKKAYTLTGADVDERTKEALSLLADEKEADERTVSIPEAASVADLQINGDVAKITLEAGYEDLSATAKVMLRASVVYTLTQIDGIRAVVFYIGGDPLLDAAGNALGEQTAEMFIDSFGEEDDAVESGSFVLYYVTDAGDALKRVEKVLYYNSNSPAEEVVLQYLAMDPGVEGLQAAYADTVQVLDVSVSEGICYVDLNGSFLSQNSGVSSQVSVYAIVNSLTELNGISKVQLLINNEADGVVDVGSLSGLYEADYDLVEK